MSSSRFMSVSDVASYCGVTNRTVIRWAETRSFVPVFRTPSGRVMFNRDDVLAYFRAADRVASQ
jgi:DNA-binding transcriptional MerR regulator